MKGRRRDCKAEAGAPLAVVQYSDGVTVMRTKRAL